LIVVADWMEKPSRQRPIPTGQENSGVKTLVWQSPQIVFLWTDDAPGADLAQAASSNSVQRPLA
jgi:hypothetical protein